ncbi:phosphonate ABC transporter, permease protein PhnE [Elioraea thermophila]|uniref:phosphonate ABC transporter, permease protein PhnE n=1 Tax=Elioraea thermophila TaxID=2185104 RepID=UPI000DF13BEE|nr:phosphonate ABC transporter, permease protein PhnE [Elioraea thermophila]
MLVFDRIGKTWPGGARALDDVSFVVPRGAFVVLLGPSGAGKSTLLRMVNGLVSPSSGAVVVDGIPVQRDTLTAVRRRVAMVHQQFNLVERLSVAANILSGAVAVVPGWRVALWWYPPDLRRRAWELCRAVGLTEREFFRRAATLSGGQQQRVGIARALILEPALLLADEPVASLDPVIAREVLALLRELARARGTTVLCSLHQIDLARDFADRIVGLGGALAKLWRPQLSEQSEVARLAAFHPDRLPLLARIEVEERVERRLDPASLRFVEHVERREVLVEPFGYLFVVLGKLAETIEIALWATLLAVLLSLPLAVLGAANYAPNRALYYGSRATVSLLRALPELISALFLVLAFGFGPAAGVLALALHSAGFLGKFFAEDIENADRKPQEAMDAIGAGRLRTLWVAVLPQVLPQYVAYVLYILDRNLRMAAVIGLVGAGGIGQELKGRWDMFQYGHVSTILTAIFLAVLVLDQVSARLRARLIGPSAMRPA